MHQFLFIFLLKEQQISANGAKKKQSCTLSIKCIFLTPYADICIVLIKTELNSICSRGQVISAHYSHIDIKIEDDSDAGDVKIVEVQDFKAVSST